MRARVTLAAVALVLVASVAAGWFFEHRSTPVATASSGGGGYHVLISRDGRQLASFNLAAFEAMKSHKVVLQGGTEEGPPLLEVLRQAGVGSFSAVTVIGAGTRDSGRLELKLAQIGPNTVIDVAKRGTVKIAGPYIPYDKRVRDIREIQVK